MVLESPVETVAEPERTVELRVFRLNPARVHEAARMATFRVPFRKGMTVLDALLWAKEHRDPSLAFRHACRMGICGSCGMSINGVPRLACETQVSELGDGPIEVGPLPTYPVIRDLATDFTDFFSHHRRVRPHLIRLDADRESPIAEEFRQTEDEKLEYYQFAMCLMCGLCNAACPSVAMDPEFLGPHALAQAYRFAADSRDRGWAERAGIVDTPHGCWRCELAASCSAVCPKGVDPALGAQLLKKMVLRRRVRPPRGPP